MKSEQVESYLMCVCVCVMTTPTRYDVELYQRIECLLGKKLGVYPTVEEEVLALMERVAEAQRFAHMVRLILCLHDSSIVM